MNNTVSIECSMDCLYIEKIHLMPLMHLPFHPLVTFAVCICIQSANNGISVLCIFILISLTNLLDYEIN